MEVQDALQFGNRRRVGDRAVAARNDQLRLRGFQAGTPIRDNTIGAIGGIPPSPIADNGMMRHLDRPLIEGLEEW